MTRLLFTLIFTRFTLKLNIMKAMILHILKSNSVEKTINGSATDCIISGNYGTVINEIASFAKPLVFEFAKYVCRRGLYYDIEQNLWYDPNIEGGIKQDILYAQFELERSRKTQNNKCVIPDISSQLPVCEHKTKVIRYGIVQCECCGKPYQILFRQLLLTLKM